MKLTHGLALGACALLLAACAAPPTATPEAATVTTALQPVQRFEVTGRFSARNGEQQASGQFQLTQDGPLRKLIIYTPLGSVAAEIDADGQQATLVDAQGQRLNAPTLADLLREVIDVPLTDAQLNAWLQGLPIDPATLSQPQSQRDEQGLPSFFSESGWDIVVSGREAAGSDGWAGPLRMRWTMQAQTGTEVRWVIDGWTRR